MMNESKAARRYWYALECPRGARTASRGDRLARFNSKAGRAAYVAAAFESVDRVDECKRDELTQEEARRWFPRAFDADASAFPPASIWMDYWGDADAEGAEFWTGEPTGGVYAGASY